MARATSPSILESIRAQSPIDFLKIFNIRNPMPHLPQPPDDLFHEFSFEIFMLAQFNVSYLNWIKNDYYHSLYMNRLKLFYSKLTIWVRSGKMSHGQICRCLSFERWRTYRALIIAKSFQEAFKYRRMLKVKFTNVHASTRASIKYVRVSMSDTQYEEVKEETQCGLNKRDFLSADISNEEIVQNSNGNDINVDVRIGTDNWTNEARDLDFDLAGNFISLARRANDLFENLQLMDDVPEVPFLDDDDAEVLDEMFPEEQQEANDLNERQVSPPSYEDEDVDVPFLLAYRYGPDDPRTAENRTWLRQFNCLMQRHLCEELSVEEEDLSSTSSDSMSDVRYYEAEEVNDYDDINLDLEEEKAEKAAKKPHSNFKVLGQFDFAENCVAFIPVPYSAHFNQLENCFQLELIFENNFDSNKVITVSETTITGYTGFSKPFCFSNADGSGNLLTFTLEFGWEIDKQSYDEIYYNNPVILVRYLEELSCSLHALNSDYYWHFGRGLFHYLNQTEWQADVIDQLTILPTLLNAEDVAQDLIPVFRNDFFVQISSTTPPPSSPLKKRDFPKFIDLYFLYLTAPEQLILLETLLQTSKGQSKDSKEEGFLEASLLDDPERMYRIIARIKPAIAFYELDKIRDVVVPMVARLLLPLARFQAAYEQHRREMRSLTKRAKGGVPRKVDTSALKRKWEETKKGHGQLVRFQQTKAMVEVLIQLLVKSVKVLRPMVWKKVSMNSPSMHSTKEALQVVIETLLNADGIKMLELVYYWLLKEEALEQQQLAYFVDVRRIEVAFTNMKIKLEEEDKEDKNSNDVWVEVTD